MRPAPLVSTGTRICSLLLLAGALLVSGPATGPASAASRDDEASTRQSGRGIAGSGFTLESELLARHPAVSAAIAAVEAAPDDPAAWRSLGRALADRGAYDDAAGALQRALRFDDADPDLWVDLGAAYLRQGRTSQAKSSFQRALKLEPFHALAFFNLGLAHQTDDDYEQALDNLERALLIDPTLGDPRVNAQAANNDLLPIVKHRVYMRTVGGNPAIFSRKPATP